MEFLLESTAKSWVLRAGHGPVVERRDTGRWRASHTGTGVGHE